MKYIIIGLILIGCNQAPTQNQIIEPETWEGAEMTIIWNTFFIDEDWVSQIVSRSWGGEDSHEDYTSIYNGEPCETIYKVSHYFPKTDDPEWPEGYQLVKEEYFECGS